MWDLTNKQKVNSTATISSICVGPKSRLFAHLCHMVPISIMHSTLNDDNTKLKVDFFNGYRDGDCVFYISATGFKGDF